MEVRLYGIIAEQAGTEHVNVDASNTDQLVEQLEERIIGLSQLSYAVAVQRKLVSGNVKLQGHEEVALLPPFAGG